MANNKDSSFLVDLDKFTPIKIGEDLIDIANFKDGTKTTILELMSMDLMLSDERKIMEKLNMLDTVFRRRKCKLNIYSLSEKTSIKNTIRYQYSLLQELQDSLPNATGKKLDRIKTKIDLLSDKLEYLEHINNVSESMTKKYYLSITKEGCNDETFKEEVEDIIKTLRGGNFLDRVLKKDDVIEFMQNIYDPFNNSNHKLISNKSHGDIISPRKIAFKRGHCEMSGDEVVAYKMIYDFPSIVHTGWLAELANFSDNVDICFTTRFVSDFEAKSLVNKIITEKRTELETVKKDTEFAEQNRDLGIFMQFAEDVGTGMDELRKCSLLIRIKASSKTELKEIYKSLKVVCRSSSYRLENMNGLQKDCYVDFMPRKTSNKITNEPDLRIDFPTASIVNAFPFVNTRHKDTKGFFMGYTANGQDFLFDGITKTATRLNSNIAVLGTSGAGKSHTTKTMIENEYLRGARIFIIDPEDEYSVLAKQFHGTSVDVASKSINILQVFGRASEDEDINVVVENDTGQLNRKFTEVNELMENIDSSNWSEHIKGVEELLKEAVDLTKKTTLKITKLKKQRFGDDIKEGAVSEHLQMLQTFFKTLKPDAPEDAIYVLLEQVNKFYNHMNINDKTLKSFKNDDWPVVTDFLNWLQPQLVNEKSISKKEKELLDNYLVILKQFVVAGASTKRKMSVDGLYASRFGKHTNIDLKDDLIVFNFMKLIDTTGNNSNINIATILLLLNFLNNELERNKGKRFIRMIIDEAHLLIKKDNLAALRWIQSVTKRGRKYNGGITITTQNINDFNGTPEVAQLAKGIIESMQYMFIGGMKSSDADSFLEIMKSNELIDQHTYNKEGQIIKYSEDTRLITQFERGRFMCILSSNTKVIVDIVTSELENKIFGMKKEDLINDLSDESEGDTSE